MAGPANRLELDGLVLRRWRRRDARALQQAVVESLDHLRPWMPWVAAEPLTVGQRRELISRWRRDWRRHSDFPFGLFAHGRVVGSFGLHRRRQGGLEIGYWVHAHETGQGLAPRAAAGLTTVAFDLHDVGWVEIHHDRANKASRRVPEKLGFSLVAERPEATEAPGETGVSCIWRVERASWRDPFGWHRR
jgi:ribosomal-protein-serine acetyltransferase